MSDFDPNDPLYWAMEHCQSDPRVKQLRWVNDNSVNLEFYNKEDATVALGILTHSDVGDTSNLSLQEPRTAQPYSKKPNSRLVIRQSNAGDQKPKGAATKSNYYQRNPDVAGNHQREPRRNQKPQKDYLDYGDEEMGSRDRSRRGYSRDQSMGDSGADRRGPRRNGRDNRDGRDGREVRGRGGRGGRQPADGRLRNDDVDSYRPGSRRYFSALPRDPVNKLTDPVHKSHASAVYEDAAPPLPPTKKATVASDSQRTRPTRAAVGTAAGVAAATTLAVAVNPAWIAGHTTGQTMIAAALRVVDVGRRTLSLTLRQWAITTTGQTPSTRHTDQTSHEEGIRYFLA